MGISVGGIFNRFVRPLLKQRSHGIWRAVESLTILKRSFLTDVLCIVGDYGVVFVVVAIIVYYC